MANMTDSFENELLDGITGVAQCSTPATVYLAAFTGNPGESGDVTNEVSGGGYARVDISGKFGNAANGTTSNTADIAFPTATADWGTVTHVGLMKSGTAGTADMIIWAVLATALSIPNGSIMKFATGDLTFTAD